MKEEGKMRNVERENELTKRKKKINDKMMAKKRNKNMIKKRKEKRN